MNATREYNVEKIIDRRLRWKIVGRTPKDEDYEYLVKWRDYSAQDNTWEPWENVNDCEQIEEFLEKVKRRQNHAN